MNVELKFPSGACRPTLSQGAPAAVRHHGGRGGQGLAAGAWPPSAPAPAPTRTSGTRYATPHHAKTATCAPSHLFGV